MARMMRNMQVPAYCPSVLGVHMVEYRGVTVLEKNVMDISDMDMDITLSVVMSIVDEVLVAMLDMAVEVISIAIVLEEPISMLLISVLSVLRIDEIRDYRIR